MSIILPDNFENLAGRNRAVGRALRRFGEFVHAHPKWDTIDYRLVVRALPDIDSFSLGQAIRALVDVGAIRQLYAVTTPSGALADETFERPTQIPAKLPDRFNEYFDTSEQDVVPVLAAPNK